MPFGLFAPRASEPTPRVWTWSDDLAVRGGGAVQTQLDAFDVEHETARLPRGVLMEHRGDRFAQPKALVRYVGRLTHMFPTRNPLSMLLVDEHVETHTEFLTPFRVLEHPSRYGVESTDGVVAFLKNEHVPSHLRRLDELVARAEWLGDVDAMSVADVCWYHTLVDMVGGAYPFLSRADVAPFPHVLEYMERCEAWLAVGPRDADRQEKKTA